MFVAEVSEEVIDDFPWLNLPSNEDSDETGFSFVDRWRNASSKSQKKCFSFSVQVEYSSHCVDMAISSLSVAWFKVGSCKCFFYFFQFFSFHTQSPYRMKYPLAIVNKHLDTFGVNILMGYDIMYAFMQMIKKSSITAKAQSLNFVGAVNAFSQLLPQPRVPGALAPGLYQ